MATRKHLSERTLRASLLVQLGLIPYEDAKKMTVDQVISLFHVDHNILHETGHPDRDAFWNLTHRLIKEHREKTKQDVAIIAKGRRIRQKNYLIEINREMRDFVRENPDRALAEAFQQGTFEGREQANKAWSEEATRPGGALRWRKIRSRGFDKTRRRKMDGTVEKR